MYEDLPHHIYMVLMSELIVSGILSGLVIIGSIFIFFRVYKINAHINESKMIFGVKFPFYITITRKL